MNHLYLASNSPRRMQLLQQLGLQITKISADINEDARPNEAPLDYVLRMAKEKNQCALIQLKESAIEAQYPILSADTIVVCQQQILGKPQDPAQAYSMLQMLSGRTHQVMSAVCLSWQAQQYSFVQISQVTFKSLSPAEINAYIATSEPLDKAGAYGIQGLGAIFIQHLKGSFTGVMGLPIFETGQLLQQLDITIMPDVKEATLR